MLPTFPEDQVFDFEQVEIPTRTFAIDFEQYIVQGHTDGLAAMRQAVFLALHTERFLHAIYSWNYGAEMDGLIGQPIPFVYVKIKDAVTGALMQDDRVLAVENFDFEQPQRGRVLAHFTVRTTEGPIEAERMVTISV